MIEYEVRVHPLPGPGPLARPDTLATIARRGEELGYHMLMTGATSRRPGKGSAWRWRCSWVSGGLGVNTAGAPDRRRLC